MLKVIKVIPYTDYTIEIHYSNKEIKIFDMKPLFKYEIYKPLMNKNLFCVNIIVSPKSGLVNLFLKINKNFWLIKSYSLTKNTVF